MTLDSVIKNSSYLVVSQVVSKGISMISLIWLARYITVENYGFLNYVLSFWAIVMNFVEGGTGILVIREVARDHSLSQRYFTATLVTKIVIGLIALPITLLSFFLLNVFDASTLWIFVLIGLGQYLQQILFYTIVVFFRAHEKFKFEAILSMVSSFVTSGFVITSIVSGFSFQNIVVVMFAANILVTMIAIYVFWNKIEPIRFSFSKTFLSKYFSASIPFSVSFIVGGIALKIPVPIIGQFYGASGVAMFSAPMRVVEGFMFIPSAIIIVLYPFFSRSFTDGSSHAVAKLDVIVKFLVAFCMPIIIYSFVFQNEIMSMLYGTKYLQASPIWPLWMLWLAIWAAKSVLVLFALSIDDQKAVMYINSAGFIITGVLSLLLIPPWSFAGATIAMLIAETSMFVMASLFLIRKGYRIFDSKKLSGIALLSLSLSGMLSLTGINDPFVTPAIYFCFYVGAILKFGIITSNERKLLSSVFRKQPTY